MVTEVGQKHQLSHAYQLFHGDSNYAPGISKWGRDGQPLTAYFRHRFDNVAPETKNPVGVMTAKSLSIAGALVFNGSNVSGGVATFDVPRNISISTGAGAAISAKNVTFRFSGTDYYGATLSEVILGPDSSLSPGLGLKAFKTVTSGSIDRSNAGTFSIGFDDSLGLPFNLEGAWDLVAAFIDATATTTSTITPADTATATGVTGDVRGTFKPSSACNGSRKFTIVMTAAGKDNKVNLYGKDQFTA